MKLTVLACVASTFAGTFVSERGMGGLSFFAGAGDSRFGYILHAKPALHERTTSLSRLRPEISPNETFSASESGVFNHVVDVIGGAALMAGSLTSGIVDA